MEKGEFAEKDELLLRLSKSELECNKLSEEVARLGDAERRYQVRIIEVILVMHEIIRNCNWWFSGLNPVEPSYRSHFYHISLQTFIFQDATQQQQKLRERVDDLEMQGADSAASDSLLSDKKEVEAKCKKLEKELQVREIVL